MFKVYIANSFGYYVSVIVFTCMKASICNISQSVVPIYQNVHFFAREKIENDTTVQSNSILY